MEEHKVNYRKEEDCTKGCIHQMAKLSRSLLWRDLCPHLFLRMKRGSVKDACEKKRRRNVFSQYDPNVNIRTDVKPVVANSNMKPTENSQKTTDPDPILDSISPNSELEQYKEKVRSYAKRYMEYNGVWYNMKDIDEVCLL